MQVLVGNETVGSLILKRSDHCYLGQLVLVVTLSHWSNFYISQYLDIYISQHLENLYWNIIGTLHLDYLYFEPY